MLYEHGGNCRGGVVAAIASKAAFVALGVDVAHFYRCSRRFCRCSFALLCDRTVRWTGARSDSAPNDRPVDAGDGQSSISPRRSAFAIVLQCRRDDAAAVIGGSPRGRKRHARVRRCESTADPDCEPLLVVPRSIWRSVQATWRRAEYRRAFAILAGTRVFMAPGLFKRLHDERACRRSQRFGPTFLLGTIATPVFSAFTFWSTSTQNVPESAAHLRR